ncbi:hypothetical protein TWF730_007820 [Orbilia blumenaviensis]|uniref:Uncharacterized protein n=1 Tax=Orbilia blumenaviensis TaxID=1796055 RepID=A0AAV9V918_9PEZI
MLVSVIGKGGSRWDLEAMLRRWADNGGRLEPVPPREQPRLRDTGKSDKAKRKRLPGLNQKQDPTLLGLPVLCCRLIEQHVPQSSAPSVKLDSDEGKNFKNRQTVLVHMPDAMQD